MEKKQELGGWTIKGGRRTKYGTTVQNDPLYGTIRAVGEG